MGDTASGISTSAAAPWAVLGRDTAAGRALFSLYNADNSNGRAAGLSYSAINRRQLSAKAAAGPATATAPAGPVQKQSKNSSCKPKVAVPHFKRSHSNAEDHSCNRLAQLPHRRTGDSILAGMQAEAHMAWGAAPPAPAGRLIDEQEKQRCALLMQYRGSIPCSHLAATNCKAPAGHHPQHNPNGSADCGSSSATSRRRLLHDRFAELADEVADREAFVSSMQQIGKLGTEHMNVIKSEVADKVREMKQLDEQIKLLVRHLD
eukprot:GHRQ01037713.1.p1 GENE.GHRQ01037713.1~~GHRQ01037713.1.p1  ORF type:complete len:262 (+),score=73.67 GHRQ01037713.1:542-1327(+)